MTTDQPPNAEAIAAAGIRLFLSITETAIGQERMVPTVVFDELLAFAHTLAGADEQRNDLRQVLAEKLEARMPARGWVRINWQHRPGIRVWRQEHSDPQRHAGHELIIPIDPAGELAAAELADALEQVAAIEKIAVADLLLDIFSPGSAT